MQSPLQTNAKSRTLREVLDGQGRKVSWVAERLGLSRYLFTYNVLNRGRATPDERRRLCDVLGLSEADLDSVLAETARLAGRS